jgi:hypothetical protein
MKQIYLNAYNQLIKIVSGRMWFEGCHKHRIVPGYLGGLYEEANILFLTQKEHSLVHFLRWKIYKDSRDKRAYKMIGNGPSGLSYRDRVDHGIFCYDNNIGFHSADTQSKKQWQIKGLESQKQKHAKTGEKNWYYWSTSEGRKERSSLGGKSSYYKNEAFLKQQCSFKDTTLASLASSKSAKKPVTDGRGTLKKFHTEAEREQFLLQNPTWRKGCPTKKERLTSVK